MTWNYRILKETYNDLEYYKVIEVYYGEGLSWCDASVDGWDDPKELKGTLEKMLEAFDKPILEVVNRGLQESHDGDDDTQRRDDEPQESK